MVGDAGDPIWDDWGTSLRTPAVPVLHVDGYDGPMQLLVDLAEQQLLDLGRLSILALVGQFVAELDGRLRQVPIERRAEWVVLASRLVLLRSRLLTPATPEIAAAAERDAEGELLRIAGMVQVRDAAAWLQARPMLGHDVFGRPGRGPDPRTASYMALMQACLVVLRGSDAQPQDAPVYRPQPPELWSVAQATERIRAMLGDMPQGSELTDFLPHVELDQPDPTLRARAAVASTLVAGLELARNGEIVLEQASSFESVHVTLCTVRSAQRS